MRKTSHAALALLLGVALGPGAVRAQPIGYSLASDQLVRLDLASGAYTDIGTVGSIGVTGAAWGRDGYLYAVADLTDDLWRIDRETAASTRLGPLGINVAEAAGLAFDACGTLWMVSNQRLYSLDPATGASTLVRDLGQHVDALTADGQTLLGVVDEGLARIDPQTGAIESFGDVAPVSTLQAGLDFDADGRLWGVFWKNGPIPDPGHSSIVEYHPGTGAILDILEVPDADAGNVFGGNLAASPPNAACLGVVDVPATGFSTLAAFGVFLATAALLFLKMR
jgi:streptogramin lyase